MAFTEEQKLHFTILGKRIGGKLECWKAVEGFVKGTNCVVGYSVGDEFWDDDEQVTTSNIKDFKEDAEYVVTNNTVYELGKPYAGFTEEERIRFHTASRSTRYGRN